MFDGRSKQRIVSGGGKKKGTSRDQILESSRAQRENRARDKARKEAATLIQCNYRRTLALRQVKYRFRSQLHAQLETIRRIGAVISNFCVPLDTIIGIMKFSLFSLSALDDQDLLIEVSGIVSAYCSRATFQPILLSESSQLRCSFQIVVSSFSSLLLKAIKCAESYRLLDLLSNVTVIFRHLETLLRVENARVKYSVIGIYFLMRSYPMSSTRLILLAIDDPDHDRHMSVLTAFVECIFRFHRAVDDNLVALTTATSAERAVLGIPVVVGNKGTPMTLSVPEVTLWNYFAGHVLTVPDLWSRSNATALLSECMCLRSDRAAAIHMWTASWLALGAVTDGLAISVDQATPTLANIYSSNESAHRETWHVPVLVNFFQHSSQMRNDDVDFSLVQSVPSTLWLGKFLVLSMTSASLMCPLVSVDIGHEDAMENDDDANEMESGADGISQSGNAIDKHLSLDKYIKSCLLELCSQSHQKSSTKYISEGDLAQSAKLVDFLTQSDMLAMCMEYCIEQCAVSDKSSLDKSMNAPLGWYSFLLLLTAQGDRLVHEYNTTSLSSRIKTAFAFDHIRSFKFVTHLWSVVYYHHQRLGDISSVLSLTDRSRDSTDIFCSHLSSHLYVLLCTLSHQLQAIDDVEFMEQTRTLSPSQFIDLVDILKGILYRGYWTAPVLANDENDVKAAPSRQLYLSQLLWMATKLYNQLAARNERLRFVSGDGWLWGAMSSVELEVVEDNAAGGFSFRDDRVTTILQAIPQVISFERRVSIFQQLLDIDKQKVRGQDGFFSAIRVDIQRNNLLHSAFEALCSYHAELKKDVKIQFISEQGTHEAGIDGGGLFKEFLDIFMKEMAQSKHGFFLTTSKQLLVPNTSDFAVSPQYLAYYEFLGRMLGKAMYEKILVEPQFAGMFLNQLLGRLNLIDDLASYDDEMYRALLSMKREYLRGGGDISELELTFEVSREATSATSSGVQTLPLIPNGSNTAVTKDNLRQCRAFLSGFRDIIPLEWIRMFSSWELQMLIGGDNTRPLDVIALKQHCTYSGGYHPSQPYIQEFWSILESFDAETQGEFLQFVTSCSRQPLLGFGQLNPPFNVMKIAVNHDHGHVSRLPMASSCFNQLKLPQYESSSELRSKLIYAIKSRSGFELT